MEGVSHATLGTASRDRFLHGRSMDLYGSATIYRPVLHGPFDSTCGTQRHREVSEWILDEPDCPQSTDAVDGFFMGKRFLIHDRDPLYTTEFLEILAGA